MAEVTSWRPDFLGPFERYRRDLAEGFYVSVSPNLQDAGGGWTWELWGPGEYQDGRHEYIAVGVQEHYAAPEDAQRDADRAVQRLNGRTEEERAARGVDLPSPFVITRAVTLTEARMCATCRDEIPPGRPAAQDAEGFMACVSCACRGPGNTFAGGAGRGSAGQRARRRERQRGTPGSRRSL
jgi:hypothetical protein